MKVTGNTEFIILMIIVHLSLWIVSFNIKRYKYMVIFCQIFAYIIHMWLWITQ